MTLRPYFEIVEAEMREIFREQSEEIAAIGYDGDRIVVQFHRFAGLFSAPATRWQYDALVEAEKIDVMFTAKIARVQPEEKAFDWHDLVPFARRTRKK